MKAALSIAFEQLRGKAGTVVVTKGRTGLVVKPRKSSANPRTTAQQSVRGAFAKAAGAYKGLTTSQAAAWRNYANTLERVNDVSGETYHPTAIDVFVGLATKFLQASPTGTIPVTPPSTPFTGDSITVSASAGVGKITFIASGSNAAGIKTELLLQPLASANRTPNSRGYRTKAIVALSSGTPQDVTVPAGYYAAAYRFVKTATGQATVLQPIAVVAVTLSLSGTDAATTPRTQNSASARPRSSAAPHSGAASAAAKSKNPSDRKASPRKKAA